MKIKSPPSGGGTRQPKPKRPPRVARPVAPDRPQRMWSLLLPPTFPTDRR
jgi:hypothetical protein